jgi:hypothetical protein
MNISAFRNDSPYGIPFDLGIKGILRTYQPHYTFWKGGFRPL